MQTSKHNRLACTQDCAAAAAAAATSAALTNKTIKMYTLPNPDKELNNSKLLKPAVRAAAAAAAAANRGGVNNVRHAVRQQGHKQTNARTHKYARTQFPRASCLLPMRRQRQQQRCVTKLSDRMRPNEFAGGLSVARPRDPPPSACVCAIYAPSASASARARAHARPRQKV